VAHIFFSTSAEEVRRSEASKSKSSNDIPFSQVMYGNILGRYMESGLAVSSSVNAVAASVSTAFQSKEVHFLVHQCFFLINLY